jgi:nucleoside-diphosphate-sugar epimerase
MRVFLTGGAGFIGSQVLRSLVRDGHEVVAMVRETTDLRPIDALRGQTSFVVADLNDNERLVSIMREARPDAAIHLAWYAAPGKYWTSPENLQCVASTLRLALALADVGCERIVVGGSCAEYDWSGNGILSEGATPIRPTTLYGACKDAAHRVLDHFCGAAGMELVWARFFFLYGPFESRARLVPSVVTALLEGREVECSEGRQLRDFLHTGDAADAVVRLLRPDVRGAFNIGSGSAVAVRDVINRIADRIGRPELVRFGARSSGSEPPLLVASRERLSHELGWTPRRSLDEGLDDIIDWWRRELLAATTA